MFRYHQLQYVCIIVLLAAGTGALYWGASLVMGGSMFGAYMWSVFVAIVVNCLAGYAVDGKTPWQILNPKIQSWAYEFGDTLALAPAFVVAAHAWGDPFVHIPSWALTEWWLYASFGLTVVGSALLILADSKRYDENYAREALMNPFKLVHTIVIAPLFIGLLIATCIPVLCLLDWHSLVVAIAFVVYVGLIIIDDVFRFVNPHNQYDLWDPFQFQRCSAEYCHRMRSLARVECSIARLDRTD